MSEYALVRGGVVEQIIVASAQFAGDISPLWDAVVDIAPAVAAGQRVGIGWGWAGGPLFVAPAGPPPPPAPPPVPWRWYIDPGSFRDRFSIHKMTVLMSTDPGIQALLLDMQGRPWIDLQDSRVADALVYIGTVIPAIDAVQRARILTTPVTEYESLALRRLYFS
ncbi:hypothetical protein [Roseateles sp.]|uniref:hypothetical protein n=1 Tax=Roseateles sp. TaxID=1971397 RepID=UPI002E09ADED|nr:hypothetical protein [Roseateles sp.]